ncbi:MAG: hypothetical protein WC889_14790, partial [Myxococcota bacterium]
MAKYDDVIILISHHMASGRMEPDAFLPALKEICAESGGELNLFALLESISRIDLPSVTVLRTRLLNHLNQQAFLWHEQHLNGKQPVRGQTDDDLSDLPRPPTGWRDESRFAIENKHLFELTRALIFLKSLSVPLPEIEKRLENLHTEALERFKLQPGRWELMSPITDRTPEAVRNIIDKSRESGRLRASETINRAPKTDIPADIDEDFYFKCLLKRFDESSGNIRWQKALLDQAFCWPTSRLAEVLPVLCREGWAQERAIVMLIMRFGRCTWADTWYLWRDWLKLQTAERNGQISVLKKLSEQYAGELIHLWCMENSGGLAPADAETILKWKKDSTAATDPESFADVWQDLLTPQEIQNLRQISQKTVSVTTLAAPAKIEQPTVKPSPIVVPEIKREITTAKVDERKSHERPAWRDQMGSFFSENWYIAAGLSMVVVGASLLAYFTWDTHWVVRYTIMPALLAFFTLSLPFMAGRIEKRYEALQSAATLLRVASIALLPINFMAVALLALDPEVANKAVSVPLMAVAYITIFGIALVRWCRSVNRDISVPGWITILGLNLLVGMLPVVTLFKWYSEVGAQTVTEFGLYSGFVLVAVSTDRFITRAFSNGDFEKRLVLFFALSVTLTFVETFALVHWTFRELPRPHVYAVMAILTGGLFVFAERRISK